MHLDFKAVDILVGVKLSQIPLDALILRQENYLESGIDQRLNSLVQKVDAMVVIA